MDQRLVLFRLFSAIAAAVVPALALVSCGSSGSTYTAPSAINKCAVAFDSPAGMIPADGGSAAIPVKAERECGWTAEPDVPWLTITAGRSGQGAGTVELTATANGDPVNRSGGVMLNGTRAAVTQAAAPCRITLAATAASMPQAGGSGSVDVRASSALCTWTAASDADWITITSGTNGKGSATLAFTVAPTTGPPRTGSLTIAGLQFSVAQSEGCSYAIAPSTYTAGSAGGSNTVSVTTAPGCPWTAASSVSWLSLAAASGTGSGTVAFTVADTIGPSRTGTATIAGQLFTVTQSPGCTFTISPDSQSTPAAGGAGAVSVTAGAGCAWTAISNAPWITIESGAGGSGNGSVSYKVAATSGAARSGSLTIAGRTFTVNQDADCTMSLSSSSETVAAGGGTGTFDLRTAAGCAWTAGSNASWLTISAGASGSGNGTVRYTAAANSGPQRTGTIAAGGQTFTVRQDAGCSFSLTAAGQSVASGGGSGSFSVQTSGACAWTATANAAWLAIASGASGTGAGTVQFTAAANSGPPRSGTITAAGQTFTVTQESGCSPGVAPDTVAAPAAGGSQNVTVTTAADCSWSAVSHASWIAIAGAGSRSGSGVVQLDMLSNDGPARSGTATIAGRTVTVNQDSGCTIAIAPAGQTAVVGGATGAFAVTAHAGCAWTAVSSVAWISITKGASGSGDGPVEFTVEANATGAARTGTITVAGKTFTVDQNGT